MKTFDFRLNKVLEYRRLVEDWAKEAYLDARAERLEAEAISLNLRARHHEVVYCDASSLDDLLARDRRIQAIEDELRRQDIVLDVLIGEEAQALHEWTMKRQDVLALERLHDRAFEEWSLEMSKEEQAFLDEWTTGRRAA